MLRQHVYVQQIQLQRAIYSCSSCYIVTDAIHLKEIIIMFFNEWLVELLKSLLTQRL